MRYERARLPWARALDCVSSRSEVSVVVPFRGWFGAALMAVALASPCAGRAQGKPVVLGYHAVVERASSAAGDVVIAGLAVGEARATLVGAQLLLRDNPDIEAVAGPRFTARGAEPDAEVALAIPLEVYGERGLRIDAAERAVARYQALVDDARRRAVAEALSRYFEALRATAALALAEERAGVAGELVRVAAERRRTGDIGDLDLGVVEVEAARARRAVQLAVAERATALASLRLTLGIDTTTDVELAASLIDETRHFRAPAASALDSVTRRPDVLAADLAVRAAEGDVAAEQRAAWPVANLRVGYQHEEGENVVAAGIAVPLPLFQLNQGPLAAARARTARLAAERDLVTRRAASEVSAAAARLALAVASVELLEADVMRKVDENMRLARRAYQVGERDLSDLLLVQSDSLDAKADYLDALLELGRAGVAFDAAHPSAPGAR